MTNRYKRFIGASTLLPSRCWGLLTAQSIDITDAIDGDLLVSVGDPTSVDRPLVRVHSECVFAEIFDSELCDCADQLHLAMATIRQEGHGLFFYLRVDGRGAGLSAKVRATDLEMKNVDTYDSRIQIGVPPEGRNFRKVGEHLIGLDIKRIRLLTNNPAKVSDIEAAGVSVVAVPLKVTDASAYVSRLYETKAAKFGHKL